jgi:hypothetical protein
MNEICHFCDKNTAYFKCWKCGKWFCSHCGVKPDCEPDEGFALGACMLCYVPYDEALREFERMEDEIDEIDRRHD